MRFESFFSVFVSSCCSFFPCSDLIDLSFAVNFKASKSPLMMIHPRILAAKRYEAVDDEEEEDDISGDARLKFLRP